MISDNFKHVENWVFDLDNTLYPPKVRLFDEIEFKMTAWISNKLKISTQKADELRKRYWKTYGTSLAGLMREYQIEPYEYLSYVHDISFQNLVKDPKLHARISSLPGRKIVYTNGTAAYAENVLGALGLSDLFECIYGVENADFYPKPERAAYEIIFKKDGLNPIKSAMFEDEYRNLNVPKKMGMKTVLVSPGPRSESYLDYHTSNLVDFLTNLS